MILEMGIPSQGKHEVLHSDFFESESRKNVSQILIQDKFQAQIIWTSCSRSGLNYPIAATVFDMPKTTSEPHLADGYPACFPVAHSQPSGISDRPGGSDRKTWGRIMKTRRFLHRASCFVYCQTHTYDTATWILACSRVNGWTGDLRENISTLNTER